MFFPDQIEDISYILKMGGILIYPTDTIWGIGCDPFNESAVDKIYEIKERNKSKSFVLLVDSIKMLKLYAPKIHPRVETLLVHHTKPLTLIHPEVKNLPEYLKAEDGSVAIRIAQDMFCKDLIQHFGFPLLSTSVNKSGQPSPQNFNEISEDFLKEADYIVKFQRHDQRKKQASVIARYNSKGELDFIRI
jgi:L-threonylcarbamoyladenylate synthase